MQAALGGNADAVEVNRLTPVGLLDRTEMYVMRCICTIGKCEFITTDFWNMVCWVLQSLLAKGACLEARDFFSFTPLMLAALSCSQPTVNVC